MKTIKIMIAENHPIFLETLVKELATKNISVIGAALNGQILIDLLKVTTPDIVILDLEMPVLSGHEVLKVLAKDFKSVKTIIFSNDYSPYFLAHSIINGARGYLVKSSKVSELVSAIQETYNEGYYFNELLSKEILFQLKEKKKLYYLLEDQKFSEREIEIIQLTCEELTAEQMADRLQLSVNTILDHKKNIFKKTNSNNIVSLVKYATKHRLINPEKPDKWL